MRPPQSQEGGDNTGGLWIALESVVIPVTLGLLVEGGARRIDRAAADLPEAERIIRLRASSNEQVLTRTRELVEQWGGVLLTMSEHGELVKTRFLPADAVRHLQHRIIQNRIVWPVFVVNYG